MLPGDSRYDRFGWDYGSLPDDGQDPMLCFVAVPTGGGVANHPS